MGKKIVDWSLDPSDLEVKSLIVSKESNLNTNWDKNLINAKKYL